MLPNSRQILLASGLLLLGACATPSLQGAARYGRTQLDGGILTNSGGVGTRNTWDGLGLGSTEDTPGASVDFKWGGPHLSVSTEKSSFSGRGTLQSTIDLGGNTINTGQTVDSDLDIGISSAILTWDIAPTDFELGLGLGLFALDLDMRFRDVATSTVVSSSETVPIPVLAARLGLSRGPWKLGGTLSGIDVDISGDQARFVDLDLFGQYSFAGGDKHLNAAILFGYRSTDLSVQYDDGTDNVDADLTATGPYIGLRLSF